VPPTNAPDIVPSAFPCCDNCIQRRRAIPDAILTDAETKVLSLIDRIQAGSFPIPDASQEVIDVGANSPMRRRGERFKVCREALAQWRDRTWHRDYGLCAWGPNALLPEEVITKLASSLSLSSLEDVKREVPDWDFAEDYGAVVIDAINKADELWKQNHEQEIESREQNCGQQMQENRELRDE